MKVRVIKEVGHIAFENAVIAFMRTLKPENLIKVEYSTLLSGEADIIFSVLIIYKD